MKVIHLNCATLCPLGGRWIAGVSQMVCHVLLIETEAGLVLVDSALGVRDIAEADKRLGMHTLKSIRPQLDPNETALKHIQRLGYSALDVTHIILTHLDLDHAGGISDFPHAKIHIFGPEYIAAMAPATMIERLRYRPIQWSHGPDWQIHKVTAGERWFDLECVTQLKGLPPEILLVPLTGHSLGHCGVAIKQNDSWLLHAGDSYFYHGQMDLKKPHCPTGLKWFQTLMQVDGETRHHNMSKLREIAQHNSDTVKIFCSHDSVEFARFSAS